MTLEVLALISFIFSLCLSFGVYCFINDYDEEVTQLKKDLQWYIRRYNDLESKVKRIQEELWFNNDSQK